ncbi:MAG: hypothetical protein WAT12_07750, partial [Candidatus Nitrotoga sp.]
RGHLGLQPSSNLVNLKDPLGNTTTLVRDPRSGWDAITVAGSLRNIQDNRFSASITLKYFCNLP